MATKWENVLLSPEQSIREALEIIDAEAIRIALVVTSDRKLLGTVTDGDIRRGLLRNLKMDEPVQLVMNKNPTVASPEVSRKKLLQMMEEISVLSIPILNGEYLVGLETVHDMSEKPIYENPVFLMAGGFGTRLKPLTDSCPKPLLKVGDKPILETTLNNFISHGFKNFYISTHYMPEMIMDHFGDGSKWGVNITYVYENNPLGTGGALGLLPKDIPQLPLLMMNGDVLTNVDYQNLLKFHNEGKADATMCVREYQYQIPYGVVTGKGNKIVEMVEKPVQHYYVNAGIYVISPKLFNSVEKDKKIDMPTLLEEEIKKMGEVLMFPIHEYWLDIGRMDDFKKAQIDILKLGL
ncbi:nucleotidyltransferase family protein [Brenneria corticis]|uniref:Alcohol dehydrogenase n=1 Tax=Brenneria corticis TaxID=2173106 RepID=A0A2U1TJY3_9GAMM|nr:nucleotidyltransferase family protein [Brenneria sp. CFCC 11842]PWC09728.1 alcohol dehydrogenase [Brenneria sp. CFCC 11842]